MWASEKRATLMNDLATAVKFRAARNPVRDLYKSAHKLYEQTDNVEVLQKLHDDVEQFGLDEQNEEFLGLAQLIYEKMHPPGMVLSSTEIDRSFKENNPHVRDMWRQKAKELDRATSRRQLPPILPALPLDVQAQMIYSKLEKVPSRFEILKTGQGWVPLMVYDSVNDELEKGYAAFEEASEKATRTRRKSNQSLVQRTVSWSEWKPSTGRQVFYEASFAQTSPGWARLVLNHREHNVESSSLLRRS